MEWHGYDSNIVSNRTNFLLIHHHHHREQRIKLDFRFFFFYYFHYFASRCYCESVNSWSHECINAVSGCVRKTRNRIEAWNWNKTEEKTVLMSQKLNLNFKQKDYKTGKSSISNVHANNLIIEKESNVILV